MAQLVGSTSKSTFLDLWKHITAGSFQQNSPYQKTYLWDLRTSKALSPPSPPSPPTRLVAPPVVISKVHVTCQSHSKPLSPNRLRLWSKVCSGGLVLIWWSFTNLDLMVFLKLPGTFWDELTPRIPTHSALNLKLKAESKSQLKCGFPPFQLRCAHTQTANPVLFYIPFLSRVGGWAHSDLLEVGIVSIILP